MIHENDLHNEDYYATYCMDDNKLRLYTGRVERSTYDYLRENGFKSTPKQDCDFVATWSVRAEDIALSMIAEGDDIGDEDQSPEDRAADRAERFSMYRDKRRDEAGGFADRFDAGPSAHGFQSQARAERAAAKHDRLRGHALTQWQKAEYWQTRTQGVISHALHRSDARTRRGRILTLEADLRKHEAGIEQAKKRRDKWLAISTMEGADELLPLGEDGYVDQSKLNKAQAYSYLAAGDGHCWLRVPHPRCEEANAKNREMNSSFGHGFSMWDLMTQQSYIHTPFERLTPKECAEIYLAKVPEPCLPGSGSYRYREHLMMRLSYENMMLENEGGKAADVEMEVGGWVGKYQIHKINKSPATGAIVSVTVMAPHRWRDDGKLHPSTLNIQRLGESVYRPPTDEEREAFKAAKKAAPKAPSLINLSEEDANKLQAYLNSKQQEKSMNYHGKVILQTQKEYTNWTKCTDFVSTSLFFGAFKLRVRMNMYGANSIIVLTDKPTKPLPQCAVDAINSVEVKA